eukprot:scaffold64909_cov28-Tisochrysis_lutea.AAC.1
MSHLRAEPPIIPNLAVFPLTVTCCYIGQCWKAPHGPSIHHSQPSRFFSNGFNCATSAMIGDGQV